MNCRTDATRRAVTAKVTAEHQRIAARMLADCTCALSRSETSFLHRIREQSVISSRQSRWLSDLDVRVKWEMSHDDF